MKTWDMCQAVGRGMLVIGLIMQSTPVAWAQLAEIDPALNAAVEALVLADPEVAGDPELARLCRSVAEATVTDIRERVAVAQEAALMQREGIDVNTVIPREVREAAREQFTRLQGDMQRELETMRTTNPERARERELMMREGERQMLAFESGERYTPSTEMITHAREMFNNWESDMMAQGAPQEYVERARMEMARFSTGEMQVAFAGPTHDFAGPMPSVEQMQAMGMTADQIQAAQAGGHTGGSNYGVNPATGGWEPGMGGGMAYGGPQGGMPSVEQMQAMGMTAEQIQHARSMEEMTAGNAVYGVTDWSAGGGTYTGNWEGGSNYGINPATGGWEPGMGGGTTTYGGGTTDWTAGGGGTTHTGGWETTSTGGSYVGGWESTSSGSTTSTADRTNTTELRQDYQSNTQNLAAERYETATHHHNDTNTDHAHTIHVHSDGARHDHTATSAADTAPGAVYLP